MTDVSNQFEWVRNDPSAVDEEVRWRAYQAWLRKTRANPRAEIDPSRSVITPREPLDKDIERVTRSPEPLAPAISRPWPWRLTLSFAAVAGGLVAGAVMVSLFILGSHPAAPSAPVGELRIQADADAPVKSGHRQPLPCFVNGRSVGELSLPACARRNGVASGPLDVGLPISASPPDGAPGLHTVRPKVASSASVGRH